MHATCWAHTRRKFIEAEGVDPNRCRKAVGYIRRLYENEEQIRGKDPADILQNRRECSLPVVEEFFEWLRGEMRDLTILPSNPFSKAAGYAIARQGRLSVFLSDPAVPIDTNHLERALRPIPMGRKNWVFCWTEVGAHHVGKIQSLLVTFRLQGLDPYTYFVDVLQRVATHPAQRVSELIPRLWKESFAKEPLRSELMRQ